MRGALVALSGLLALLLSGCGGTSITPPRPPTENGDQRASGAASLLQQLQQGLATHDPAGVLALAAPDPQSQAYVAGVYANAQRLALGGVTFRYVAVDEGDQLARLSHRYAGATWSATVHVTYRIPTYDPGPTHLDVELAFVQTKDGVRLGGSGGSSARGALWLSGPLQIDSGPRWLVLSTDPPGRRSSASDYAAYLRKALSDVGRVLPSWRGSLVLEVPASEAALEQLLAETPQTYSDIAAVTTTVDGSVTPGTPVHVYLNPNVFLGLPDQGRQVVISHESTHVATQASFALMPTWLLEGFADYVALDHAGIPVQVAARQIIAEVRRHGAPTHLPTADDLSPSANGLGATYESAWTACRYLGRTYGERDMVRFYYAVDQGQSVLQAFRSILGVTQAQFVRGWRDDLLRLAHGQPG